MQNKQVKIKKIDILSDNWYTLKKVNFDYQLPDGSWQNQNREAYDRGNGAVILLYNKEHKTVILTRQFRMPTYINGNEDGMMIELPAGLLDNDHPADAIKRETEEETGYRVSRIEKVFESYMSPGSVTEILHFFIAEYEAEMKVGQGGGHPDEHEDIEVIEMDFTESLEMIRKGTIKDAKTIMLLQYAQINKLMEQ
ncbi:GDP-mannose pyrophosphatase NudK [Leptobacterium flavescens]|uniref:GDP-mannose pyrophosphatase n=1 Tax=Leptobacterium flavescens TaxID=472055 RepID=A0A6P0USH3_9FLAO|nr:GDP-mannose pyrophosphatase NudK [Leptobacterium flavescens]NER15480.1 GDP-mannose pyrophosphatase NudK [Leptobacterium flavescens]